MSFTVLLVQHNEVVAFDIVPERVEKINRKESPIQDKELEEYLADKELNLTATTEGAEAYKDADFVIISTPTNYDPHKNYFDCSAVEEVSFFNELDTYAEVKGLNMADIIKGVSLDPRIGDCYNNSSFGYGGYCLPKDTKQMVSPQSAPSIVG